ncbi:isochorismate synthase [Brenneria rubrifaciens]|uniref:isochorismate synthase n=1 Tax=Brenneria rubrifaciens TaxID=55213 RepID=A0A4P8QQB0_9GAMM|nr:isochorismate synthase [Brenneria rubrifaciens]QCR07400.1 isochorismate synthase [Brenneria rubrifaciens]
MDTLIIETDTFSGLSYAEQSTFLYASEHRSLLASGFFERLSSPVSGEEDQEKRLHSTLAQAFERARSAGQTLPVVVGAIPFDTRRPSCLYIPEHYRVTTKSNLMSQARRQENAPSRVVGIKSVPDEAQFKAAVAEAVAHFQAGKLSKAVLSRILDIELAEPINAHKIMNNLMVQNPGGYHFSLPLPDGSILLGASPELLLRKQGKMIYSNPLAGSACRMNDPHLDHLNSQQLLRSSKDRHEHRLVVDDIRQRLMPLCLALTIPDAPSLMSTASMWHLSTAINGELARPDMTALQVACQLHPTPALCGFPTEEARRLIADLEPHERGVFSGIVGWCDANGDGEWAIVIRCGTIRRQHVRLFAGAGIVAASVPEEEWGETAAKLNTMLNAFGLNSGVNAL